MEGQDVRVSEDSMAVSSAAGRSEARPSAVMAYDEVVVNDAGDATPPCRPQPVPGSLNRRYTDFLHVERQPSIHEHEDFQTLYNADTRVYYKVIPIDPPDKYPALNFRPTILKSEITILLTIIYVAVVLALAALLIKAGSDRQLRTTSNNAYIVARYVPVVLGTITLLLFRNMASQLFRLMPYIAMADQKSVRGGATAKHSIAAMYFPIHNPLKPNTSFGWFKSFAVFFTGFIVSLKTVLFTIDRNDSDWVIMIHATPAKILMGGYTLMVVFTVIVTRYLWSRNTGLQTDWNPASIADIVALFNNFNVSLDGIELEHDRRVFDIANLNLLYRLGYWQMESDDRTERYYVYGIRGWSKESEQGWLGTIKRSTAPISAPKAKGKWKGKGKSSVAVNLGSDFRTPRPDAHGCSSDEVIDGYIGEQSGSPHNTALSATPSRSILASVGVADEGPQPSFASCSCETAPCCVHYPYRKTVFYSRIGLAFWLLIIMGTMALLLYCLCMGYCENGFRLDNTWWEYVTYKPTNTTNPPPDSTTTNTTGNQTLDNSSEWIWGSWAPDPQHDLVLYAVVFRSVPAYVAGFFADTFLGLIDTNHRFIQPFLNMYKAPGSPSQTILLDYMTISPVEVALLAWNNSHYKVAWFSFVYTVSPLFPIVVISLNSFTNTGSEIILDFSVTAYVVLMSCLAIYVVTLGLAWPITERLVPRNFNCLLDIMAMCHQSHFLRRPEFNACQKWWTKEHLKSHISVRDDRYLFGHYKGVDGKIHLGFDMAETHKKHFLNHGNGSDEDQMEGLVDLVKDEGSNTNYVEWVKPLTWIERRRCKKAARKHAKSIRQKNARLEGKALRPFRRSCREYAERQEEEIEMVHRV